MRVAKIPYLNSQPFIYALARRRIRAARRGSTCRDGAAELGRLRARRIDAG